MSLRVKLLLPLLLLSLLLCSYLYCIWMPRSLANAEIAQQRAVTRHLESVAEELIPLLLANQLDVIHENLNALRKKNSDWMSVRLQDSHGKLLYPLSVGPAVREEPRGCEVRIIMRQISYLNMDLGSITVAVDFGPALADLRKRHSELMIMLLAILSAFILTMDFVVNRIVSKPVRLLATASVKLAQGDFFGELPPAGKDEVGALAGSFTHMRDSLLQSQSELLREIAEHQRTEQELIESEEKFRSISASAQDAIIMMDDKGNISYWNEAAERIFGYPSAAVIGKELHSVLVPLKYRDSFQRGFQVFRETGTGPAVGKTLEMTALNRDGAEFPVELALSAVRLKEKWHATCILRDITRRKDAEEELKKAEQSLLKLSHAVEQSPVSIMITDEQGRIEYVNPYFVLLTGYSEEEVTGKNPRILKSGETPSEEYKKLWNTISSGGVWRGEFHNRKKNGELFWEAASISPVLDPEGKITHYVAIKEDVTGRKKLEEQLRHAQKMEAVGQLAGGVAHDFNNLLTALIGYGTLLRMNMEAENPLRKYVEQILSLTEKSANLTRKLLTFSRKQVISLSRVNMNDIIRGMEKLLQRLIGEEMEFKLALSERDLTVMADTGQIEQVLMNLCTNARDAMSSGGLLSISSAVAESDNEFLTAHGLEKTGAYAVLSVSDTGTGMDEKTMQRIFDPFFTTKEVGKGTGLGLSIVYGIIKQHNGAITAYSEPGKGSTFKIYLPLIAAAVSSATVPALPPPKGGTEAILVAEDNDDVRALTARILGEFGYRVIEAEDGEAAIARFRENIGKIDLVLLDVIMPKKSGKEAYDAIREMQPSVKALFTSGYTADVIQKKGIYEGMHFISKPVAPNDLLRKVREILDSKS